MVVPFSPPAVHTAGVVVEKLTASPDDAVAATVRPRERIDPVPEWVEIYRERREHFRALYPALRGVR